MKKFDFRAFVTSMVKKNNFKRVAEVGVYRGQLSKRLWSLSCIEQLFLIDPWSAQIVNEENTEPKNRLGQRDWEQAELDDMFSDITKAAPSHVAVLRTTSAEAAKLFPDASLDFVFIDAAHNYENVKEDISIWRPKVKIGGILAGDDYSTRFYGVRKAVEEMLPGFKHKSRVWWKRCES